MLHAEVPPRRFAKPEGRLEPQRSSVPRCDKPAIYTTERCFLSSTRKLSSSNKNPTIECARHLDICLSSLHLIQPMVSYDSSSLHTSSRGLATIIMIPPELLMKICAFVNAEDHLCFKLSCKTFNKFMPKALRTVIFQQWGSHALHGLDISIHHDFETYRNDLCRGRLPTLESRSTGIHSYTDPMISRDCRRGKTTMTSFFCNTCRRWKGGERFVDSQAALKSMNRSCIPCIEASDRPENSARVSVKVKGEEKFVCLHCSQAKPLDQQIFLRDGERKSCLACAYTQRRHYTIAKRGAPCPFVVYDDWIDIVQLKDDIADGFIGPAQMNRADFKASPKRSPPQTQAPTRFRRGQTPPAVRETLAVLYDMAESRP